MPDYAEYLLFVLGVFLIIGGFADPERFEVGVSGADDRVDGRYRLGIHRYRVRGIGGIILGALVIGVGVYGNPTTSAVPGAPEPVAVTPAGGESVGYRTFESDLIKIEIPAGWKEIDAFGLAVSDLDFSEFPRSVRRSILGIPAANADLQFFAYDKDRRATLVIFRSGKTSASIPALLERRESLYNWSGIPVTAAEAGLVINGMDAGTMTIEPIYRYELFREKQYIVTTEIDSYFLYFSTWAESYEDSEPVFEEIAGSFHVLAGR